MSVKTCMYALALRDGVDGTLDGLGMIWRVVELCICI